MCTCRTTMSVVTCRLFRIMVWSHSLFSISRRCGWVFKSFIIDTYMTILKHGMPFVYTNLAKHLPYCAENLSLISMSGTPSSHQNPCILLFLDLNGKWSGLINFIDNKQLLLRVKIASQWHTKFVLIPACTMTSIANITKFYGNLSRYILIYSHFKQRQIFLVYLKKNKFDSNMFSKKWHSSTENQRWRL